MQPKHIILIVFSFLLVSVLAVLFVRWLNPPPTLPAEYKKEMQNYREQLKLILETKKQDDRVIQMADRVIKLYDQVGVGYQSTLKKNDIQIKIIQQDYVKNNKYDTIGVSGIQQYISNYK